MDAELRIPLTGDQKSLIRQAADGLQVDMAAWARPILLDAAKRQLLDSKGETRLPPLPGLSR
jgi:hypothetical protein